MIKHEQLAERLHVGHDPLHDAFLFVGIRYRDFDRAVEAQLAIANFFQRHDRRLQNEVGR